MKKRISFLLALMMALNLFGVMGVSAAEIVTNKIALPAGYEFSDSAYGCIDGRDTYLVAARKYDASANGQPLPMIVYGSTDKMNWEVVFSSASAYNTTNKRTRNTLVYWEAGGLFAINTGENIYTSSTGLKETWRASKTDNTNQGVLRGNGVLTASGNYLAVSGGRAVKIATPDTIFSPNIEHIIFDSNSGTQSIAIGASEPDSDGNVTFVSVANTYNAFFYGYDSENNSLTGLKSVRHSFTSSETLPRDIVYEKNGSAWLIVNDTDKIYKFNNNESKDFENFGAAGAKRITAVGTDGETAVIGTADAKLYYTDSKNGVSADSEWTEAECGTGMMNDEPRSITPVDGGYLVVTASQVYFLYYRGDSMKYYNVNVSEAVITEGEPRIIVPAEGTKTLNYVFDYKHLGEIVDGGIGRTEAISYPEGVSYSDGELSVSSDCPGGEVIFEVTLNDNKKVQIPVTIVDEKSVEVEGPKGFLIPQTEDETYVMSAYIAGTDGERIDERSATLEAVSLPEGVFYDADKNVLTITVDAKAGKIVFKGTSDSKSSITNEIAFDLDNPYANEIHIVGGDSSIVVSDDADTKHQYTASVLTQSAEAMRNAEVSWRIEKVTEGIGDITINDEGLLTVPSTAYPGTFKVVASVQTKASEEGEIVYLSDEKEVTLTITDNRKLEEDKKEISKIDFTNLEKNCILPDKGSWGSLITWESDDESIITSGGVITKDNKEIKRTKLRAKFEYKIDDSTSLKDLLVFEVSVAVNDNIFVNGDIETGDTTGFSSEGEIAAVAENVYEGSYSLKSDGAAVSFSPSVPTELLDRDSAYYFEAYVSAPKDSKITMTSDAGTVGSAVAAEGYTKLTGSMRVIKAGKHTLTISVDKQGGFMIDNLVGIDITEDYNVIARAVSKAESTKENADVLAARALLEKFYDCPAKDEFKDRLDKIKVGSGNSYQPSGGGSGGGSGSGSSKGGVSGGGIAITTPQVSQQESEAKADYARLMFKDMDGHWAKDDVEAMGAAGIISGRADGVFDPNAPVTRAEFAVLISRTTGLDAAEYENTFFDVISDDWYAGYVQAARNAGYLTGSNGLFSPNNNITREEIARIVVSAYAAKKNMQIEQGGALYYNDIAQISPWAYDYIVNAVNLEFMQGMSETIFAPKETATRAQAAVILKRLLDKLSA